MKRYNKLKIGIIGFGAIGSYIAEKLINGSVKEAALVVIAEKAPIPPKWLLKLKENDIKIESSWERLFNYESELIIECATQDIVRESAPDILRNGKNLMIMSVGALLGKNFFAEINNIASKNKTRVFVPSGAIGAIDAIRGSKLAGLKTVILTTRKPPRSLGLTDKDSLNCINQPKLVFEGTAREAVLKFPKNINVAATISLAGIGPTKTLVRIIADPNVDKNIHEIKCTGSFGSFEIKLENEPSPQNPKTSFLACVSAIALLNKLNSVIQIGS